MILEQAYLVQPGDFIGDHLVIESRVYLPNPDAMWLIYTTAPRVEEFCLFVRRDHLVQLSARRYVIRELGLL